MKSMSREEHVGRILHIPTFSSEPETQGQGIYEGTGGMKGHRRPLQKQLTQLNISRKHIET